MMMISVYFRKSTELSMAVIFVVDAVTDVADGRRYLGGMRKEFLNETLLYHLNIVNRYFWVFQHLYNDLSQGAGFLAGREFADIVAKSLHIIFI